MGQGYSMTTLSAASATIDVPELTDLTYEKTLASARFMKSVRARSQQGSVFVKAVMKPYSSFDVRSYVRQITEERNTLADVPNALGYQRIIEVGSGGFLVRQYMFSSVYDRLSTRPFLEEIEKKWLVFQLLCAVKDCHARNVYHGDIKTENLLVTSWNWLYLTDFSASFKPTNLPEDNPADFSFYFDTSGRRICYVAPERFSTAEDDESPHELNWAMDMFSIGCTIAEIFLEGPVFSLSQVFKYKTGDYSPEHIHVNKIEDTEIRAMILNMIELDPEKRYSAEQHLSFYKTKIFPDYFYSFLHQYMQDLTETTSGPGPLVLNSTVLGESDHKIEKVYHDFDKISYFLGYTTLRNNGTEATQPTRRPQQVQLTTKPSVSTGDASLYDGSLLFLTLISSSIRNTAKASARLKACDLLLAFSERLPDEAKLDRVLPYMAGLLNDRSDAIKSSALRAVTAILDSIDVVSPINAYLFPEYIFPKLRQFLIGSGNQPSPLVRATYASCLASLALSSGRMLDMVQAIRADGRIPSLSSNEWSPETSYHGLYDIVRAELVPHFEEATTALITDPDPSVRRALLGSVSRLCVFFGSAKASDVILSHLNTYLNDKDWILRCSFYDVLVGVASYIGSSSLEKFILPVMIGSLTDPENFVVEKVIRSLSRMANLGLFRKTTLWELSGIVSRYLVHPSLWIRESAVQFLVHTSHYLPPADRYCILLPMLQPFLKAPMTSIDEDRLLGNLKTPISKNVFDAALLWATRKEKSLFWTAASRDGVFTLSDSENVAVGMNTTQRLPSRIPPSQRDKEDQASLDILRNQGMVAEDEVKLLGLREYILKISTHKTEDASLGRHQMLSNIIPLTQIEVTPQNVIFDQREPIREVISKTKSRQRLVEDVQAHSIADALYDASMAADEAPLRSPSHLDAKGSHSKETQSQPMRIANDSNRLSHDDPDLADISSSDRPNMRVETLRVDNSRRSSSIGGRHALLDPNKLSASRKSTADFGHRNNAINLLNRVDTMKAEAEISTTPETAFGKIDGALQKRSPGEQSTLSLTLDANEGARPKSPFSRSSSTTAYEANHSYIGTDANVLRLLEHHFMENFPIDLFDFGASKPSVDAAVPIRRAAESSAHTGIDTPQESAGFHAEPWRPTGQLLTQFAEHTAAVNRVVAAPDHAFFVTASDDGTCKVWDTIRLEKNITTRSRYTHRREAGVKVKSLCFIENTHTFVSGGTDGSIHALRIEYKSIDGGDSTKYGKPSLVRDYQIPNIGMVEATGGNDENVLTHPEYAVWLHHYRTPSSQSVLLVATSKNRILMLDMKNMDLLHSMHNPVEHGTLTTFCVDRKHHWLLLGTSHGILDLWDLRFKLRLRAFGVGGSGSGQRIDRLLLHPSKGHGRWVIVSCGGEIGIWDIEKMVCREVLRPSTFLSDERRNGKSYEAWSPDDEPSEVMLDRFSEELKLDPSLLEPIIGSDQSAPKNSPTNDNSKTKSAANEVTTFKPHTSKQVLEISALFILNDYLANIAQPENPNKSGVLFSAGADRALRYWDIAHIDKSFIVSGPMINIVGEDVKQKVRYESSWPSSMSLSGLVQLVEEKIIEVVPDDNKQGTTSGKSTPKKRKDKDDTGTVKGAKGSPVTGAASKSGTGSKMARNTIISSAQQQLLSTHLDSILDICVLRKPYGCISESITSGFSSLDRMKA